IIKIECSNGGSRVSSFQVRLALATIMLFAISGCTSPVPSPKEESEKPSPASLRSEVRSEDSREGGPHQRPRSPRGGRHPILGLAGQPTKLLMAPYTIDACDGRLTQFPGMILVRRPSCVVIAVTNHATGKSTTVSVPMYGANCTPRRTTAGKFRQSSSPVREEPQSRTSVLDVRLSCIRTLPALPPRATSSARALYAAPGSSLCRR
ncbi:MAG: hypothetical protein JWM13_903, partial [Arthrobacter sp.]|nr:hypothetical protein [Arthrobacter sp.]